jgi:SulP family sulfate permease
VLLPAQQINQLDSSGADRLERLRGELDAKQITLSFAEAKAPLREMMSRTELEEKIGGNHFYQSVDDNSMTTSFV